MQRRVRRNISSNCTASADTKLQLVTTNSSYHASMQILHHTASAINILQLVAMFNSTMNFQDCLSWFTLWWCIFPETKTYWSKTNHFTWNFFLCKMCGFWQMGQRMAILCLDQCYIHWIGNILGLKITHLSND